MKENTSYHTFINDVVEYLKNICNPDVDFFVPIETDKTIIKVIDTYTSDEFLICEIGMPNKTFIRNVYIQVLSHLGTSYNAWYVDDPKDLWKDGLISSIRQWKRHLLKENMFMTFDYLKENADDILPMLKKYSKM